MERLTLVVTVWAVKRVIWVIGSWAGVTLQMTFLPGIPTQSPSCQSVKPFLRECQTPHGEGASELETNHVPNGDEGRNAKNKSMRKHFPSL